VHRGEITVGSQAGRSIRYLARGDTMKLAHRLCGEADLGEVLVSEKVASLDSGFRYTRGPLVRIKSSGKTLKSFQLQGARERSPVVRGRWVERGTERVKVDAALAALSQGQGGVISITGPAGTGKSRLLRELQDGAGALEIPCVLARARPYRGYRPFDVLRAVVAHVLGIEREAGTEQVKAQIHALRRFRLSDRDIEVIGAMFGLPMNARQRVDVLAMKGAAARMLSGLAQAGPVVVLSDDVQYIGSLEREIIGSAVRARREGAILFVFAGRGDLPVELRPAGEILALERLSSEGVHALTRELLGVAGVDGTLLELVAHSAEGNPLYIDEITRMLRQEGRIVLDKGKAYLEGSPDELHLPPGLEALIAARIDALGPAAKGVVQIGATIGTSFSPQLVGEASGLDDIEPLLIDLERRGIICRDPASPLSRCSFSSVLVWELVHRSIKGVRLTEYHRMVAKGMERLYRGALETHRMQLAGHCADGGRFAEAAEHAELAGDQLRDQQLLRPAIECWEQGVQWLDRMDRLGHSGRVCEAALRLKAGMGWRQIGEPSRAELHLQVAQDLANEAADLEIEARSTLALGRLYRDLGRPILARASLDSARSTAADGITGLSLEGHHSWRREVAVEALADLGIMALDDGDAAAAEDHLQSALQLAGSEDGLAAQALVAMATRTIRSGDSIHALRLLLEGRERAERAGDRILLGRVENNIGIVHHLEGRFEQALGCFREALNIRQGLGYRMGAVANLHNIGDAHFRLEDPSRAWAAFHQSRDLAEQMGWQPGVIMNDAFLAFLEAGEDREYAIDRLEVAVSSADKIGLHETRVSGRWLLGRLYSEQGQEERAQGIWMEACALADELDAPRLAADIRLELSARG
jgi:tetratricopeptide (TPR) repeat protein